MYTREGVGLSRRSQVDTAVQQLLSASVQHGSQFGRKALCLPPLGVPQLEPFL